MCLNSHLSMVHKTGSLKPGHRHFGVTDRLQPRERTPPVPRAVCPSRWSGATSSVTLSSPLWLTPVTFKCQ